MTEPTADKQPKISVVTHSCGTGEQLERTIVSVLGQDYPNLEYILISGGDNDAQAAILRKYRNRLLYRAIDPDLGVAHFINSGIGQASGDLITWLNPSHCLTPGALAEIGRVYVENPGVGAIVGAGELVTQDGLLSIHHGPAEIDTASLLDWSECPFCQPSCFFARSAWDLCGPLSAGDGSAMDLGLWLAIAAKFRFVRTAAVLSQIPLPSHATTPASFFAAQAEAAPVIMRYGGEDALRHHLATMARQLAAREQELLRSETEKCTREKFEIIRLIADRDWRAWQIAQQAIVRDHQLERQARQVAEYEKKYQEISQSRSWRLTFPLRTMVEGLRSPRTLVKRMRGRALRVGSAEQGGTGATIVNTKWPESKPLVSVVIPCFNYGDYVREAIDSVLTQTFPSLEIIVVDGGSTDGATVKLLRQIDTPNTRIYFRDERHLVGDNRNFGIAKAQGKYVCCLDADDCIKPTYLEKAVFLAEVYGYDIVYPSVQCFGDADHVWNVNPAAFLSCARGDTLSTVALFRRDAWERVGGYRDWGLGEEHVPEDWDFWLRLLGSGYRACRIPEPLMLYRVHGRGLTATNRNTLEAQRTTLAQKNAELFSEENLKRLEKLRDKVNHVEQPFANLCQERNGINLLIALPYMVLGGADVILSQVACHLRETGFRLTCITTIPADPTWGDSSALYEPATQEIFHLPRFLEQTGSWQDFVYYLIESRPIDLIMIVGSAYIYELLPDLKRRYPHVRVVDQLFNEVGHIDNNRKYASFIDHNIVTSDLVRSVLRDTFGESDAKIDTIIHGVDVRQAFSPATATTTPPELAAALSDNPCVVGYFGRFSEEKCPGVFVEVAQALADHSGLFFIMTGAGPQYPAVKEQIERLGLTHRFFAPGIVADVRAYLDRADIVVIPSRIEGIPIVLLESLSLGKAVVATRVGGIPTVLTDEVNGLLCDPDDVAGIAERVIRLQRDRDFRERMGRSARAYAETHLDIGTMNERYSDVLLKIVKQLPGGAIT